jgi:hypothetical protein
MVSRISYRERDIKRSGKQVASGKVKGQGRVVLESGNGNLDQLLHVICIRLPRANNRLVTLSDM